ncbi:MAG: ATP-binding cassette domain-containing protein [Bacteroidales bacterium]|jgi:cell division transport system ATP-binding protein|nr:ATP-binding cassette domain-containing protein [Bacteroidales bacterium]
MNTDTPIVFFRSADISNGEVVVVDHLDLTILPGEFVYLTGSVGSGKTSIIRTLTGENPPLGGEARVGDFDLTSLKSKQIPYLRRGLGIVFQDFQLLMDRSVEDNLLFALRATGWKDKAAMAERIDRVLEAVGLSHKAYKQPHQLSGGEQQRAAIARALLNEPPLILADEPTGNLDEATAGDIMNLLFEINRRGTAILMVTHNLSIVRNYPARVLKLENGTCHEEKPEEV